MAQTWFLFCHFWRADWKSKHSLGGLLLFAVSTVYAVYQVVRGRPDPDTWNALAWVILLFTAFNGVSRTLEEDRPEVLAYLRTTVEPLHFMLARMLYNAVVLAGLSCAVLALMGFLLGLGTLQGPRLLAFLGGMVLTAAALGTTLTLLALIAARAGAGADARDGDGAATAGLGQLGLNVVAVEFDGVDGFGVGKRKDEGAQHEI